MKGIIAVFGLLCVASILFPFNLSATGENLPSSLPISESCFSEPPSLQDNNPQSDQRPMIKAEGAKIVILKGSEMGLPKNTLPGAKFISYAQWKDMKEIPKTGLYLVNMTHVPMELPARLKAERYTLKQDGTLLDEAGQPVAVFTRSDYFQLQPEKQTSRQKTGWADDRRAFDVHASRGNSFSGPGPLGNPYDFRCVAVSGWSVYHGGFCRDYVARTYADAYGFDERGGCSRLSPHTRIESIETRAEIRGRRDLDTCRGCERASSRVRWDIGCWWPAHGGASSFHFVDLFDLGTRFTRAWTWTA